MRDERLLQGMQARAFRDAFDGDDLGILVRDGQRETAIDAPPIEQDSTRATLAVIAALLGAGDAQPLA